MNKNKTIKILLFLLLPFSLFGQIKIHKHITTEDGLVNNRIFSILQDSKGYLWFATSNGISRWDGINFKNLLAIDGLAAPQVNDIKEGPDGTIYFTTYGGGITYWKDNKLNIINEENGLLTNWTTKLFVRENGDIYITGQYNVSILSNGNVKNIIDLADKPNGSAWVIHEAQDSTLYVGTLKGLKMFKNDSLRIFRKKDGLVNDTIWSIAEGKDGIIYLGTNNGISLLEDGNFQNLVYNGKQLNSIVPSILISSDNTIYYATSQGLLIEKNNELKFLKEENGLQQNEIWSLAEDVNGTIYIGTKDHGVDVYRPDILESFVFDKNIHSNNILSMHQDKTGRFYFGTDNGILISRSSSLSEITTFDELNGKIVNIISGSDDNRIFFGLNHNIGVLQNGNIQNYSMNNRDQTFNRIRAITETESCKILIGSQSGAYYFENERFIRLRNKNGKLPVFIQSVFFTKDSTIIFGSHGDGVFFLKNEILKNINEESGLTNSVINCIHQDTNGSILVGTDQGGLNILRNNIVVDTIDLDDGLTSNTIMDIVEDDLGNIYLSTTRGVNILSFHAGEPFIRTITKDDGLISNNLNISATYKDSEGNIWFGTTEGISKFNPKADKTITNPPKIYLTGLKLFNKDYLLSDFLANPEFNYNENFLNFIFTGINLSAPEKIRYKYRLSGMDKYWVESSDNSAPYTNLDDGNYTFEVKAGNEWGYWSKPISTSFTITPAWWETWWFRLAIISFIGGLLWLAFQYRLNYLLKVERLRTKIASDLHDEVGSLLTQISLNVDLLSYTKDENKRIEKSNIIRRKSTEVISMMSDVIWSIDSRNDNMESLAYRIQSFAESFAEQKDITLNFNNQITDMKKTLKIDFRQNIMMITKEVINNSIKYSDCTAIKIILKYKNNIFELIISDNGKGIDYENVVRGNGLKNIKMRAKLIDAKVEFKNDNGCKIHLTKTKL